MLDYILPGLLEFQYPFDFEQCSIDHWSLIVKAVRACVCLYCACGHVINIEQYTHYTTPNMESLKLPA